jgi:hypothetical protein
MRLVFPDLSGVQLVLETADGAVQTELGGIEEARCPMTTNLSRRRMQASTWLWVPWGTLMTLPVD